MRKPSPIVVTLAVALVVSNAFWLYRMVDAGVSYTYLDSSYEMARNIARQAVAALPVAARPSSSRTEVIAAARLPGSTLEPFEKDGFTWVDSLGLKFDQDGRLSEVRPGVDPF